MFSTECSLMQLQHVKIEHNSRLTFDNVPGKGFFSQQNLMEKLLETPSLSHTPKSKINYLVLAYSMSNSYVCQWITESNNHANLIQLKSLYTINTWLLLIEYARYSCWLFLLPNNPHTYHILYSTFRHWRFSTEYLPAQLVSVVLDIIYLHHSY
jgi:hypothetical protein